MDFSEHTVSERKKRGGWFFLPSFFIHKECQAYQAYGEEREETTSDTRHENVRIRGALFLGFSKRSNHFQLLGHFL